LVSKINIPNLTASCHQIKSTKPDDIVLKNMYERNIEEEEGEIKSGLDGTRTRDPMRDRHVF
jgi:hypothetical protein